MKNKTNSDKEMAELFLNMYMGCLKFNLKKYKENSDEKINCDKYYDKFNFFAEKYVNSVNKQDN